MENSIVLTYKGDDKYRTHLGGIASLMVVFIGKLWEF